MTTVTARRLGHRGKGFLVSFNALLLMAGFALAAPATYAANTVGTAPGQFSVSPTGAATYQIPIDVPPGVNGLKPSLALLYNSQAGNGIMGQGWSLSGLSVISHCPQTIDQDNVAIRPLDWNTDRLCLDGQRLILVSGNSYGALNSTYRTEIDSFRLVKITSVQQGTDGGPLSFSVIDRAGLTSIYDKTLAGGDGSGSYVPLLWLVSSTTDKYGNFINYSYNIQSSMPTIGQGSWETISKITYGNPSSGVVGKVFFSYSTGLRADSFSRTFAFTLVQENPVELNTITVKDGNNNVLSALNLGYQDANLQPPATSPTELKTVQECGSDGTCFPVTTFTYDGLSGGFAAGGSANFVKLGLVANKYYVADFDGDGLPDYVFGLNGVYYVEFGNNPGVDVPTGVGDPVGNNGGITLQDATTMDLHGDGKQELFVQYFGNPGASPPASLPVWNMFVWNGQSGTNSNLVLEDVPTTDGQPLHVCKNTENNCSTIAMAMDASRKGQTGLFFEDGQELYYYANVNGKLNDNLTTADTHLSYQALYGGTPGMTPVNYTSLGQAEVYIAGSGVVGWDPTTQAFQYRLAGNFGEASFPTNSWVFFLDSTGSGLTDAVFVGGTSWGVSYNTGAGFALTTNMTTCATAPAGLDVAQTQPIDWFGDGRQELIVPAPSSNGGSNTWYLFEVSTFGCSFVNTGVTVPSYDSGSQIRLIDVNDDGQLDVTYTTGGQTGYLLNQSRPYMINQITNGLGHNTDIGYVPLGAETLGAYVSNPFPNNLDAPQTRSYMGAMYIVKDYAVDTGTVSGGAEQQIYTYYIYGGAAIEQWGRGFLGFSEVQAINFNTGIYTTDLYNQNFPFAGTVASSTKTWDSTAAPSMLTASVGGSGVKVTCGGANPAEPTCEVAPSNRTIKRVFASGGNTISVTTSNYQDAYASDRAYPGVYSPYASSSTTQLYDIHTRNLYETTQTISTYQVLPQTTPIGTDVMPTDIKVTTQDNTTGNSSDQNTVETKSDYSAWEATCPGHPGKITVIHSSPALTSGLTQNETFTYDGNCFLTEDDKTIIDPAGSSRYPMTLTKEFVADGYGNPLQAKVSGSHVTGDGNGQRVTTMTYDLSGRFPATIANPFNQTESLSYDSWGNKLTDMDANGNTVTYTYDGFERKKTQSGPLPNARTTWTYGGCSTNCVTNTVFQVTQTGSDGSSSTTEMDELGRAVRKWHMGFGGETINQDAQYDLLGRPVLIGSPTKTTHTCWDQKVYDVLNRVQFEYQPLNSSQCDTSGSSNPSGERTITTSYDGLTTTRTVAVPSTGGASPTSEATITTLNVLGKPASVTDEGGQNGAQVATTYGYDVWGNLTSVTPPPAQPGGPSPKVVMTYDSIGDKLSMQDPDMGAWSYTYDAVGELLTQTDANGNTVSNQYDWLGRVFDRQEAEGETRWVYDIAYGAGIGKLAYTEGPLDSNGFLTPNGAWEGYAYDGFGETTDKITVVKGQEYWVTNTYDDQGRVSQVVYPNMTAVNVSSTPAVPAALTVAVDPNDGAAYDLTWQINSTQNGQIFHLYRTLATATQPGDADEIYSGPVPNWQDTTITTDNTYVWWIKACNDTTCSGFISSAAVNVILPPTEPGAPQSLADSHQRNITLTWGASTPRGGTTGAVTYDVYSVFTPWGSTTPGTPTIITGVADTGAATASESVPLSQDGTYVFSVRACQGPEPCSAAGMTMSYTTVLAPSAPGAPNAPATVTPTTVPADIPISWAGSTFTGGPVIYEVQAENTIGNNQFADIGSQPGSATSVTDIQDTDGLFLYRVQACDTNEIPYVCSGYVQVSAPTAVTLPPVNVTAPIVPPGDVNSYHWIITYNPTAKLTTSSAGTISYYIVQYLSGVSGYTLVPGPDVLVGTKETRTATAVSQGGYFQNGTYSYSMHACTADPAVGITVIACSPWVSSGNYPTVIAPGAPTAIRVPAQSNWDGSFSVAFSPPAADTGGVVTGYSGMVYDTACTDPPNVKCIIVPEATCTATASPCSFPANKLPAGNGYSLQIKAIDNGVPGAWVQENEPNIVYTSPPPAPTLNETDAPDGSHYTITYSAPTATTYRLYFSSATQMGAWSAWTQVYSGSSTSYYTENPIGQYNLRYYAVACNQHAQCSPNSSAYAFTNPKDTSTGGCRTCSQTNPPTPAPAPGSTASAVSVTPERLALSAHPTLATSMALTRVMAPEPELPALRTLALNTAALPAGRGLKRLGEPRLAVASTQPHRRFVRLARGRASPLRLLATANLSPRQAYFLAHAGRTTAPSAKPLRRVSHAEPVVATARYAPPMDPILSLYPPLRGDIRVLAHFVARGGNLPVQVRNADADCRDTDNDVECTTPDSPNALMVGYVYNSHGYLQKVEKLDASGTAIAELWQATSETAFGQVDNQVFDAPENSTAGAFSISGNYDTGTGMLNGTSANAADTTGGVSSLNAGYGWDGYNNLLTRSLSETVPAGQTGASNLSESFTYDAVNRMTGVTDSASNATTMQYDSVGGLSSNGLYTGYAYGSPDSAVCSAFPFGPVHAVSSLKANGVTRKFCYDANGNMTIESGDVGRTVAWTSYNKPSSITSGATNETFIYGPGRERLQTTVVTATGTVTTTYIDGLFEQVQDSVGNITYKHYIVAGGARIGVETIATTSGSVNSDLLSFFVQDQVGSVIAEVTEGLYGTSQQLAVYSHDPWGKARPTSGTGANIALLPGIFQPDSAVMSGQHEGFAGHEDLEDIGIVDMEGRIYDPEVGRFLSADPTVEYPDSSQGYNRYTYCNSNPLSFSDPSGYSYLGDKAQEGMHVVFYAVMAYALYEGFGQYGWNAYAAAFGSASITGYESSGGNVHTAVLAGLEAMAFTYAGHGISYSDNAATALLERSAVEGVIGGAFSQAGGGRFSDGFIGSFVGSETSNVVDDLAPNNEAARLAISAMVGGSVSGLSGGNFTTGAISAAMQRLFNDEATLKGAQEQAKHHSISLFLYSGLGLNGFGHIGASVDGGMAFGFDPASDSLMLAGPGIWDPIAEDRIPIATLTIQATPLQAEEFQNYILQSTYNHSWYELLGTNCTTSLESALTSAGFWAPHDLKPSTFMNDMQNYYSQPQPQKVKEY